jgi:hypothetical protein
MSSLLFKYCTVVLNIRRNVVIGTEKATVRSFNTNSDIEPKAERDEKSIFPGEFKSIIVYI